MKASTLIFALSLALGGFVAPASMAQAVDGSILPFPPAPSASTPGLTIQDSIYKKRVEPKRLACLGSVPGVVLVVGLGVLGEGNGGRGEAWIIAIG